MIAQLREKMTIVDTDVASMRATIDYTNYDFMKSAEAQKLFELVKASTAK